MRVIVVENDPTLRLAAVLLDPTTSAERRAAWAAYMRHDQPDFEGWASAALQRCAAMLPARIVMVSDLAQLHAALPEADAVILEDLPIGPTELALAPKLRAVQTFGTMARRIDAAACAARACAGPARPLSCAWTPQSRPCASAPAATCAWACSRK